MTTRQFVVALLVLVVSGVAGGLLGAWALPGRDMREVRTGGLLLIDEEGDVRARLFMRGDDPVFALVDQDGDTRASLFLGPLEGERDVGIRGPESLHAAGDTDRSRRRGGLAIVR